MLGHLGLILRHIHIIVKRTISFTMSLCLSAWNKPSTTGQIFIKFHICILLKKFVEKKFYYNLAGTVLYMRTYILFMAICQWILLEMRSVLGNSCSKNLNTHFMSTKSPPTSKIIVLFMRQCGKIWYSRTGHR
jgi:hypothetical protein